MTVRDTSVALVTVTVVEPEVPPDVAVIVVLPVFLPYAYACPVPLYDGPAIVSAEVPAVSPTVAMLESEELQVTDPVRSFVVLSV